MLRAVFFTVATVSCLFAAPPVHASDRFDVFEANEAPEQGMKRLSEARKKAAAARKGKPEAPGPGFRGPDEALRASPAPIAAPEFFQERERERERDRDHDDGWDGDHDDDDRDDGDDDDGKKGKGG